MVDWISRPVIVVHGLWLGAWSMKRLERRFRRHGFETRGYSYPSVCGSVEAAAMGLAGLAHRVGPEGVSLVGHSLGGIVVLHALRHLELPPGRAVLLGSPLNGCEVARRFARWPGGKRLLGRALEALLGPAPEPPEGWQVGMVAGRVRLGLGILAGGHRVAGDGTVAIRETRADFLTDHVVLAETHTSLQLSRRVADAAAGFLRAGRFNRADQ